MKYFSIIAIAVLLLSSCDSGGKASSSGVDSTSINSDSADNGAWDYSESEDEMTSKKIFSAELMANETLYFSPPYDGRSKASLIIRNSGSGNDALLSVSKGQFITRDGTTVKIKFDSAQPVTFNTSSPSDGSTNAIFIENTKKLIKKIKSAKKIKIQAEFYDDGLKIMTFDVAGFKWTH